MPRRFTFEKAPLIEVVAEIRWQPNDINGESLAMHFTPPGFFSDDSMADRFAVSAANLGFNLRERMVPPGFPSIPGHISNRYKSTHAASAVNQNYMYQIGPGVFSANAFPPYSDWEDFSPIISQGIAALFTADANIGKVSSIALRYINAFRNDLTNGLKSFDFIKNKLLVGVDLPASMTKYAPDSSAIIPNLTFRVPLEKGHLQFSLAEGKSADEEAVIFDIQVEVVDAIAASVDAIIPVLNHSHSLIRDLFTESTVELHAEMKRKDI